MGRGGASRRVWNDSFCHRWRHTSPWRRPRTASGGHVPRRRWRHGRAAWQWWRGFGCQTRLAHCHWWSVCHARPGCWRHRRCRRARAPSARGTACRRRRPRQVTPQACSQGLERVCRRTRGRPSFRLAWRCQGYHHQRRQPQCRAAHGYFQSGEGQGQIT